jgi:hypothetical protein
MSKLIGGEIIGQGTYGCVHKPQMECDSSPSSADTVSKIMLNAKADSELAEFAAVAMADPTQTIHLGTPIKCAIKNTPDNIDAIDECNNTGVTTTTFYPNKLDDYALLVMKDGGQDLTTFGEVIYSWANASENQNKMELFWLEVSRLFYGLKVFKDAGIVHHDITQNNVVYNINANRLNFIDFGLMTKPRDIVEDARNGRGYPRWWSLPWEISDFSYSKYKAYVTANDSNAPRAMPSIADLYNDLFHIILPDVQPEEVARIKTEMSIKYNEQTYSYRKYNYAKRINESIDTTDSYGVGIAMLYILNRSRHLIDSVFGDNLNALFTNMISPLVSERYSVGDLIAKYIQIMTESGFLEKHNKHYDENFLLVNNDDQPPATPEPVLPGGRYRPRSRKSKSTRRRKSTKRTRSRKANKAKRSHKKH